MNLIAPSGVSGPVTSRTGVSATVSAAGLVTTTDPQFILDLMAQGFVPDLRGTSTPPYALTFNRPGALVWKFLLCL